MYGTYEESHPKAYLPKTHYGSPDENSNTTLLFHVLIGTVSQHGARRGRVVPDAVPLRAVPAVPQAAGRARDRAGAPAHVAPPPAVRAPAGQRAARQAGRGQCAATSYSTTIDRHDRSRLGNATRSREV